MSLTVTIPSRYTENDSVESEYYAVHNPINILVERKDFAVVDTQDDGSGNTQINVTGTPPTLTVGGDLFVNIGVFGSGLWGTYEIISNTASLIIIDLPFTTPFTGGYVNLITDRLNYFVYTRLQTAQPTILAEDGTIPYIYRKDFLKQDGTGYINVADQMRSHFERENTSDYQDTNIQDEYGNCVAFTVEFLEVWEGSAESFSTDEYLFAVNAAMQVQNEGGSNMVLYIPTNAGNDKAKFLTDVNTLRYWEGLPFDIHALMTLEVSNGSNAGSLETRELVYAGNTLTGTFSTALTGITFANQLVQRYTLQGSYASNTSKVLFSIYSVQNITEVATIRIAHEIPCNPVYLYWLNKKGGYSYYCFSYRQQLGNKTASEGEFSNSFIDLEDQFTTSSYLAKTSETYMIVGAEQLDMNDINLMISLIESPSVFMLMNAGSWASNGPVWREVKVTTEDFKTFNTKNTLHNFELKLRLAETFIQRT